MPINLKYYADELDRPIANLAMVDPVAAAERALGHLPIEANRHATSAELSEAIKELAHGLASLSRRTLP